MPTYDYACAACGSVVEAFHSMSESPRIACGCGHKMAKAPTVPQTIIPCDLHWHAENKGKGKYISGLGKRNDPSSYVTSLQQAKDRAKQRGLSYETA